ncbi:MAG: 3'-5' exonuclease, partial [Patescibacteria group bacterium]
KTKFRALDAALSAAEKKPLVVLSAFLETAEYFEYMAKNLTNLSDREENIVELTRFAGEFEELTPLLEAVTLLQATDDKNANGVGGAPVTLMTMHLAKGLEFNRVYVAGCAEGLVPHGRSLGSEAELEEERRLLYVAMTRARLNLMLSFFGIPSRFLSEIPREFLAYENTAGDRDGFKDPDFNDEERYITLD